MSTIAELWKEIDSQPGPLFKNEEARFEQLWREIRTDLPFLALELEYDLGIPVEELRQVRCDSLSVEGDKAESDGLWLHLRRLISKDASMAQKYRPFWQKVYPAVLYHGHTPVVCGEATKLESAAGVAFLQEAVAKKGAS